MKILLLGHGTLGIALLQGLLAAPNCYPVGVCRWSKHPKGRGYRQTEEKRFQRLLQSRQIPDLVCSGVNTPEFADQLERLNPDALLFGSWGEIVQERLLSQSGRPVINCHPSLLPAHRGPNPYASVILAGEPWTGVTFHQMTDLVDGGPIWLQKRLPIPDDATGGSLRDACAARAQAMVPELIARLAGFPTVKPMPQEEAGSSYFPRLAEEAVQLSWQEAPERLERGIRAMQPWRMAWTLWQGILPVGICKARLISAPSPIFAGEGKVVAVEDGKPVVTTVDPSALLRITGYRLYWAGIWWPEGLSRSVGRLLFHTGGAFKSNR